MLEEGKTYTFTSRSGESKDFTITMICRGFHNWHGKTRSIHTEYCHPETGRMRYAEVRTRLGEWYVRVLDQHQPERWKTYWRPGGIGVLETG